MEDEVSCMKISVHWLIQQIDVVLVQTFNSLFSSMLKCIDLLAIVSYGANYVDFVYSSKLYFFYILYIYESFFLLT